MWLSQHVDISITLATLSYIVMKMPFKPLVFGMLLANLIDIDHAFFVGADSGHANSLIIHTFHIYSGLIASIFYLAALKFAQQRYFLLGVCYGLIFHTGADAIATFMHYQIDCLLITSIILLGLLWYVLNKFMNKRDRNLIWISAFIYSLIDLFQMYINYFVLSNAYSYSAWSWVIAASLLLVYCLIFRYAIIPYIEDEPVRDWGNRTQ